MNPVGDKPPNVYWRRRVVVLVALVVVIGLVVWLVKSLLGAVGGGDPVTSQTQPPASTAVATASATADPSASASASTPAADGSAACATQAVAVTATSAAKTVKVGTATKIGMTIENTGADKCTLDAGSANLELVISSGSERIWSSDDCQKSAENRPTVVDPGAKLQSEVPWDVVRSAQGCPSSQAALKAGTYQLTAKVGDIDSAPLTFTVED